MTAAERDTSWKTMILSLKKNTGSCLEKNTNKRQKNNWRKTSKRKKDESLWLQLKPSRQSKKFREFKDCAILNSSIVNIKKKLQIQVLFTVNIYLTRNCDVGVVAKRG